MANLLTITKKPHGFYDFVVNENLADIVTNDMNRFMGVGYFCHFKTVTGANVIKEQNITFGNITLIDGSPLATASSMDDLINKLESIGFFDWRDIGSGTGGIDRYEELIDTEPFFGNDGKVPIVDEAEMKLKYTSLPDVSYLDKFPTPLVAGMMLKVNAGATAYELVNALNVITQEIRAGYTETAPSEDKIFQALATIQASITGEIGFVDYARLEEDTQEFVVPEGKTAILAIVNYGANYLPETLNNTGESNTFTQTDDIVSFSETLVIGNYLVIFYQ